MFLLNGNPISLDVAFTYNEIQYPSNWIRLASQQERAAIGITEAPDPEVYDQRFWWGVDNPKLLNDRPEVKEDGTPLYVQVYDNATESMVDTTEQVVTKGLKSQWTAQVKDTAGKMLAQTDWYVIRRAERNVEIPGSVATYRAAVVTEAARLEAAIAACASVEELIAVVGAQAWPAVQTP